MKLHEIITAQSDKLEFCLKNYETLSEILEFYVSSKNKNSYFGMRDRTMTINFLLRDTYEAKYLKHFSKEEIAETFAIQFLNIYFYKAIETYKINQGEKRTFIENSYCIPADLKILIDNNKDGEFQELKNDILENCFCIDFIVDIERICELIFNRFIYELIKEILEIEINENDFKK